MKHIIIGISGASGAIYGIRLLQMLKEMPEVKTHLVISQMAQVTIATETHFSLAEVHAMADYTHTQKDLGASIASGSFKTLGMVVAPCSMRSLAEIATSATSSLLTRAADVVLKERRRLVLMVRETPLHNVHLRNMLTISEMGGIIAPPVPAFYQNPVSLDEMVDHTLDRILDLFELEPPHMKRWAGLSGKFAKNENAG
jgi:flavin prenyltransferase